jgi:2-keto-4-pentenoate hydratase/2-oxohepta-3-ene-1,7-dioic acid hydratase in catechol pathway
MKLVSFASSGGWHPGVILDDAVFDIDKLLLDEEAPAGSTRENLRRHGGALPELARRLEEAAERHPSARAGAVADVVLGPPVTDPAKVLCIGLNYSNHVAETGRALPQYPDVFAKFASSLIGPHDEIRCSSVSQNLDFEGEVAIVIGRDCRSIDEREALDAVAGLMVLNDLTARDLQYRGTQWLAGKAVDRSTPCGPAIVTLDEIGDPQDLALATRVNGVEMQASNTRHMIFPMARLVAYVSTFLALAPGDVIATGTPEGIGAKRQPPVWLQPGDVVEIEVARVGILRNVVR